MSQTNENYLNMSDDEFLKANGPSETSSDDSNSADAGANADDSSAQPSADDVPADGATEEQAATSKQEEEPQEGNEPPAADPASDAPAEPAKPSESAEPKPDDKQGDKPADPAGEKQKPAEAASGKEPDYKAFYDGIIGKPIRANGKEITLRTPEEVERFVQMGAGFGRKLQEIQPHLKTLRMLEKENALDPEQISYLLDLKNKNPEAIKRLIKESGINPLDINLEEESTYKPTDRTVSDKEMAFRDVINELDSRPEGKETIKTINDTWDSTSKNVLWANPELLSVIQTQRDNGIYTQIVAEVDRQKLLGMIPTNAPFIEAYKIAGDFLVANSGFVAPEGTAPTTTEQTPPANQSVQPKVLDRRTVAPKPDANAERAKAASPPQPSSKPAQQVTNPLAMADDEFLKNFTL